MDIQRKKSVAELASTYGRQMFHVAFRLLSDAQLAEDITQDVFIKLFRLPEERFDSVKQWSAFLKATTIRTSIDYLRKNKRLAEESIENSLEHNASHNIQPHQSLLAQRDISTFKRALLQLTEQDAEIFCLRHIEEYSYAEIAKIIGITSNAVGVSIHRSQVKLSSFLGESELLGDTHVG